MARRRAGSFAPRLAGALLVVVCLMLGAGAWPARAAGTAAGSGWRVVSTRTLTIRDQNTYGLAISPNGQWLDAWRQGRREAICFYAVTPFHLVRCTNLPRRFGALDATTMVWSPDSSHLAFTQNILYMDNPDLWVLDVATGGLRDLTPDGGPSNLSDVPLGYKGPKALIDQVPAWSQDGKSLLFARTVYGGHDTSLYRIPTAGGTPTRVAVIATEPNALGQGLSWLPDGRILFTPYVGTNQDPRNGLWLLGAGASRPRELLKPIPQAGPMMLLQVSADARTALVWYPQLTRVNYWAYAVVDLVRGVAHPLGPPPGAPQTAYGPSFASLSPDGAWLFCLYDADFAAVSPSIRSVHDGHEWPLSYRLPELGTDWGYPDEVANEWVGNRTVYLSTGRQQGVLLTLQPG